MAGVTPDSPAARAGIAVGDVLQTLDGEAIADLRDFSAKLRALAPGQTVQVTLDRAGQAHKMAVTVVER